MAEWYTYAIGMFAAGLGLLVVYIILRRQQLIGSIPVLSNIVDPLFYGKTNERMTMTKAPGFTMTPWKSKVLNTVQQHYDMRAKKLKITNAEITVGIEDQPQFYYEPETGDYIATGLYLSATNTKTGYQMDPDPWSKEGQIQPGNVEIHGNLNSGKYQIIQRGDQEDGSSSSERGTKKVTSGGKYSSS